MKKYNHVGKQITGVLLDKLWRNTSNSENDVDWDLNTSIWDRAGVPIHLAITEEIYFPIKTVIRNLL